MADHILTTIIPRVHALVAHSLEVERCPDDSFSKNYYRAHSIYKNTTSLFNFKMGILRRTLNVGGVYVGTDKFSHFSLIGRSYFRFFFKKIRHDMSEHAAEKKTIRKGIRDEFAILGYYWNGVFSFADLEANYQGMLFALSMCRGENPYLIKKNNRWVKNPDRNFDIKDYINPKMDESYNYSLRSRKLWKKVRPVLREVYCPLKENPIYVERMLRYSQASKENNNDLYIKEYFSEKSKFDRDSQSPDKLCPTSLLK
jgi:hypothetical protein